MGRLRLLLATVCICAVLIAAAAPATAATPFSAGAGHGQDLAVGSDGSGHVAWVTDEADARVGYCRVPAGGSGCDGESGFLTFPPPPSGDIQGPSDAAIFTPAPNKVVILASCWNCTAAGGTADRVMRWISSDNGANFSSPAQVGSLQVNGQAGYLDAGDIGLVADGGLFQAVDDTPISSTTELELGGGFPFVYSPAVVPGPAAGRAVHVVNDLDTVKYAVFTDPSPVSTSAGELNLDGNWNKNLLLSGAEGDNDETHLSSGPSGVWLSYRTFVPNDNRVGMRRFDAMTNSFGSPTYVEGPDAIENNSLDYPHHSQDASGRIHLVWRTLHDGNRLRYRRSDDGGASFTPAANLATHETFLEPLVEAAPSGTGFAAWRSGSTIRVVPIDPQSEPAGGPGGGGPGGPDTAGPGVSGFGIGDSSLRPGQGTTFSFSSSEGGLAVLTIEKRVPGLRLRQRGRTRCLPQTRGRARQLRRSLSRRADVRRLRGRARRRRLARLLRRRRCNAYRRIGQIRQAVTPGRNTIVFTGRIAGRRLSPGRYRAKLVVTDAAGNVSRTETLLFRVVAPRRPRRR
jgi:hypothetical protein